MAKKRSDKDEVQSRWHLFIKGVEGDPALQSFFQRHHGVGEEPRTLFEAVGEDLASSREEIRAQAFWILIEGMPELADILHERESRRPGWRSGTGEEQQVIDRGMDIVTYLHGKLVKEHRFMTKKGKDPRPYVKTAIKNRKNDIRKKEKRVFSLDKPLVDGVEDSSLGSYFAATLPDPTSVEEEVVEELYYEHGLQQIRTWNFLQEKELGWFAETYVAKRPFNSVATQFDTSTREDARIRKSKSRARQKALKRLESIVGSYFISLTGRYWTNRATSSIHQKKCSIEIADWLYLSFMDIDEIRWSISPTGISSLHQPVQKFLDSWFWEWAQQVVRLEAWKRRVIYQNQWVDVSSLTRHFDGSPGHLFFVSLLNKDGFLLPKPGNVTIRNSQDTPAWISILTNRNETRKVPVFDLPNLDQAVNEAVKAGDTPMIIYDPGSTMHWNSVLHSKLGAY